jgi:hypothetical protein
MSVEDFASTAPYQDSNKPEQHTRNGIIVAAILLGASGILRALAPSVISEEVAHRILGALLGAVVLAYANAVPKLISRRLPTRRDPALEQAQRRFVGWSLVIGGLGYSAAWVFAPIGSANLIAGTILASTVALAIGRVLLSRSAPRAG